MLGPPLAEHCLERYIHQRYRRLVADDSRTRGLSGARRPLEQNCARAVASKLLARGLGQAVVHLGPEGGGRCGSKEVGTGTSGTRGRGEVWEQVSGDGYIWDQRGGAGVGARKWGRVHLGPRGGRVWEQGSGDGYTRDQKGGGKEVGAGTLRRVGRGRGWGANVWEAKVG
eukprot:349912-Chlamydomonas_euryale.AAC.13